MEEQHRQQEFNGETESSYLTFKQIFENNSKAVATDLIRDLLQDHEFCQKIIEDPRFDIDEFEKYIRDDALSLSYLEAFKLVNNIKNVLATGNSDYIDNLANNLATYTITPAKTFELAYKFVTGKLQKTPEFQEELRKRLSHLSQILKGRAYPARNTALDNRLKMLQAKFEEDMRRAGFEADTERASRVADTESAKGEGKGDSSSGYGSFWNFGEEAEGEDPDLERAIWESLNPSNGAS
jgi:hypothetical protein